MGTIVCLVLSLFLYTPNANGSSSSGAQMISSISASSFDPVGSERQKSGGGGCLRGYTPNANGSSSSGAQIISSTSASSFDPVGRNVGKGGGVSGFHGFFTASLMMT